MQKNLFFYVLTTKITHIDKHIGERHLKAFNAIWSRDEDSFVPNIYYDTLRCHCHNEMESFFVLYTYVLKSFIEIYLKLKIGVCFTASCCCC